MQIVSWQDLSLVGFLYLEFFFQVLNRREENQNYA